MSLIDEALKRAREQGAPASKPDAPRAPDRTGADPWAYAPLPHARRRGAGTRRLVLALSIVVAGGVVAALWLRSGTPAPPAASRIAPGTHQAPPVSEPSPAPSESRESLPPPAAPGPPQVPANAAPVRPDRARVPSASASASGSASAPMRAGEPATWTAPSAPTRPPAAAVSAVSAAPPKPAPARESAPGPRAVDGRTYVGSLVTPAGDRVELGGIVYSEVSPSALLNGRVLAVGGVVEGMTIVRIEENRVELSKEGLTVFLALR